MRNIAYASGVVSALDRNSGKLLQSCGPGKPRYELPFSMAGRGTIPRWIGVGAHITLIGRIEGTRSPSTGQQESVLRVLRFQAEQATPARHPGRLALQNLVWIAGLVAHMRLVRTGNENQKNPPRGNGACLHVLLRQTADPGEGYEVKVATFYLPAYPGKRRYS